jgi:hypothetical protein
MPRSIVPALLVGFLGLGVSLLGCRHTESPSNLYAPHLAYRPFDCGPDLSREQILEIARRTAFPESDQSPEATFEDFELTIWEEDCEYVFFAVLREPLAVEPVQLTIDRFGRVTSFAQCCWLGSCPELCFEDTKELTLTSLRPECHIQQQAADAAFHFPWSAWLMCDEGEAHLITHPLNLLGKVEIRSEGQALEFLRFFSSPQNHRMFSLGGLFELNTSADYWGQDLVEVLGLGDRFHSPTITSAEVEGFCHDAGGIPTPCMLTDYTIERFIISGDAVYQVREQVTDQGLYRLSDMKLVLNDLGQFGPLYRYSS